MWKVKTNLKSQKKFNSEKCQKSYTVKKTKKKNGNMSTSNNKCLNSPKWPKKGENVKMVHFF